MIVYFLVMNSKRGNTDKSAGYQKVVGFYQTLNDVKQRTDIESRNREHLL